VNLKKTAVDIIGAVWDGTSGGPQYHVLDGGSDPYGKGHIFGENGVVLQRNVQDECGIRHAKTA